MNGSWTGTVQFLLVEGWLFGSLLVWAAMIARVRAGRPLLERHTGPVAAVPFSVVFGVIGWLTYQFVARLSANPERAPTISLFAIQFLTAINLMIAALLPVVLTDGGRRRLAEIGLSWERLDRQVIVGGIGFLAAVWPTGMLLLASRAWRSVETQHALLRALQTASDGELIAWVVISAVIAAPLAEELLFRVVLQGWLSERLPGPAAIGITAVIFALVHGWRDALPLVPLSLILGYVYDQTRRYWSCVAIHALFNAAFLALQMLSPPTSS